MSRSFKHKPFQAICGGGSAKQDKRLANRGVRRAHSRVLHKAFAEHEYDVMLPHRLECAWNDVYSWGRDGHQTYQGLDARDWSRYLEATNNPDSCLYEGKWPPQWYVQMMRK